MNQNVNLEKIRFEYEKLSQLEQETTKIRLATFTAFLSVSFALPALVIRVCDSLSNDCVMGVGVSELVFLFGFFFYCFAVFYYHWHHRYSHRFRRNLRRLECDLDMRVYRKRMPPKIGPFQPRFVWTLYILGTIYGIITICHVGAKIFFGSIISAIIFYGILLLLLKHFQKEEPYW